MKKINLTLLLIFSTIYGVAAQVGIGTTTPAPGAILDLTATEKALLLTRVADVNLVKTPVSGMIVYDISNNCIRAFENGAWSNCLNGTAATSTTGGTAIVSAYVCNTASAGTMTAGTPVSGVTQTITATVTNVGTYNIATTANGVTFAGSGTFAGTGAQTIVLTATGTPTAAGANSFTLNTTPNCNFSRTTISSTSNGTAVVSAYSCTTASAGTMTAGTPVSGVTQTITATVTSVGTYNIATTANGVTFAGAGTFAGTGAQNIVLTATGTPTAAGANSFTLNTTPNCNFSRSTISGTSNGTAVVSAYTCNTASAGTMTVGTPVSGVTQTITATVTTAGTYSITTTANGVTFAGSGTFAGTGAQTIVLTATGTPTAAGANSFTLNTTPNCNFSRTTISSTSNGTAVVSAYSCNTASAGTMTAGTSVSGVTQTITATVTSVGTYNISTTANGVTFAGSGTFAGTGAQTIVLTATGTPTAAGANSFTLNTTPNCNFSRTTISSTSNGTAVVSAYSCTTASAGTMTAGTPVSGVTQTITATVTTAGSYSISTTANGVTFAGSGTFAGTGAQTIVLTATGTPTAAGANSFTLNTTPNCNFSRTTISSTSNGTAVVSAYSCSTASADTMTVGTPVSGVTQTITATVTTAGSYSISTTANGVTFAGSGTFAGTGAQTIVLTATGTPTAAGANSFTLNTTPNCNFSRTTITSTSNGTAVVSAYSCSTVPAGILKVGVPVSDVTQTITVDVTTVGTYSISTSANGVTFAAAGTFSGTGAQEILLIATGTPTTTGSNAFILNTTPDCSFVRYSSITGCYAKINATNYKDFLCHNLGANATLDPNVPVAGIYGDYYQWGRSTAAATILSNNNQVAGWNTSPAADTAWQDAIKTANDPCPAGFKVPTSIQLYGVPSNNVVSRTGTWADNDNNFGSAIHWGPSTATKTLTLLPNGFRKSDTGQFFSRGEAGRYWTSSVLSTNARTFVFGINSANGAAAERTVGFSVRCISQ